MPKQNGDPSITNPAAGTLEILVEAKHQEALLKTGVLLKAILTSANFSIIATDAKGVIQLFNVGAERILGYAAIDVINQITPADISDPQEVIARGKTLSSELVAPIAPGFEALVFKASHGIEDIYELTYIRKDGRRFPAVVSVTALRDAQDAIIGYLLIGTDNTACKQVEAEQEQLGQRLRDHQLYTRSLFESYIDAIMTTDPAGIITDVNKPISVVKPHFSKDGGEAAPLARPHAPREGRLHILLYVEDNQANLKLVEQIVARHSDLYLLTAVNGNNGIKIARISLPEVILMDINLPDINGFEALKILRSDPATAHIPVIAISANAMPGDIENGREAGFFRYITKPIKINEFMEALDVALVFARQTNSANSKKEPRFS